MHVNQLFFNAPSAASGAPHPLRVLTVDCSPIASSFEEEWRRVVRCCVALLLGVLEQITGEQADPAVVME